MRSLVSSLSQGLGRFAMKMVMIICTHLTTSGTENLLIISFIFYLCSSPDQEVDRLPDQEATHGV
jgi:hypothetical protein